MSTLQIVGRCNAATNSHHITNWAHVLADKFVYECGMKRLPWMTRFFQGLLDDGFDPELLEILIDQTAHAPRPSYAYLSYMIRLCDVNDVKTADKYVRKSILKWDDAELPR